MLKRQAKDPENRPLQSLILTPGSELAEQTAVSPIVHLKSCNALPLSDIYFCLLRQ